MTKPAALESGLKPSGLTDSFSISTIQEPDDITRNKTSSLKPPLLTLQRRNSSFAEFFEGDFGQSLLSRKHFRRNSVKEDDLKGTLDDFKVTTFGNDKDLKVILDNLKVTRNEDDKFIENDTGLFMRPRSNTESAIGKEHSKKKKLSKILPSHWFFTRPDCPPSSRTRTVSEGEGGEGGVEEGGVEGGRKNSLSRLIARHFTASTDVLEINIVAPTSQ